MFDNGGLILQRILSMYGYYLLVLIGFKMNNSIW